MDSDQPFEREKHVTYLQMMYQLLPHQYQTQEINRLTLAYFVVAGLDLLRSLDCVRHPQSKLQYVAVLGFSLFLFLVADLDFGFFRLIRMR